MKKLNLILLLTLLLCGCSIDNDNTDTNEATIENVNIEHNNTRVGSSCYMPLNHLILEIEYINGISASSKSSIRSQYANLVGRTCIIIQDNENEIWIVDSDIYYSDCYICLTLKCCKDKVIEDEDDVNKVNVLADNLPN